MALPPLNPPPTYAPLQDGAGRINPIWARWFELLWRKTGESTNLAPLSIEGTAAVATQAQAVATTQATGSPEGVQSAPPGAFYIDTAVGATYVKQSGIGPDGWISL